MNLRASVLPQKLDKTLALKHLHLIKTLTAGERRVAAAIVNYFNNRTGRCDPSIGGIAEQLGISKRTVIRATKRLSEVGLFTKSRHGGYSHRNSYEPNWKRFRQLEAEWNANA